MELPPLPAATPPEAAGAKGERRQLTVLFADLVGATALSGQLDQEAMRDILRHYQRVSSACIDGYGGVVQQYLGDGVLAYFGYPSAHDNDAERAVLAGLALVAAVDQMSAARVARGEVGVQARVGVHTGLVVIGAKGAEEVAGGSRGRRDSPIWRRGSRARLRRVRCASRRRRHPARAAGTVRALDARR